MASTGLGGPHPLTTIGIASVVTGGKAGAYALGRSDGGKFLISRVGRSDTDLANRLGDYVGQYTEFKFGYLPSAKDAFEKECRMWHDFSPPNNKYHPDRPDGTSWACPVCNQFG